MVIGNDAAIYRLLSSPFEGDFLQLNDKLMTLIPKLAMSRLSAEQRGPAVGQALSAIATGDFAETIFRPEIGTAGYGATAIWQSDPSPEWMVGQFLIGAFFAGALTELDHRFAAKHPIVVAGRVHRSSGYQVVGSGDWLHLDDEAGVRLSTLRRAHGPGAPIWLEDGDAPPIEIGSLSRAKRTFGDWTDTWGAPDPERRPDRAAPFAGQVSEAFALMEESVPEYYLWTASILREVIAKGRSNAHTTTSCSHLHNLGAIEICAPASLLETAEMFVHECSHQHYQLVCWTDRFTRLDAPEIYSVLKRTSRPLDRVLLGYHAFANCLYMYHLLERRNAAVDRGDLSGRIRFVRSVVDALYAGVVRNKHWLTPAGLAIFQPLTDRLVAEDVISPEHRMLAGEEAAEILAD